MNIFITVEHLKLLEVSLVGLFVVMRVEVIERWGRVSCCCNFAARDDVWPDKLLASSRHQVHCLQDVPAQQWCRRRYFHLHTSSSS